MTENADGGAPRDSRAYTVEQTALDGMPPGVAVLGAVAARTDTDVLALDPLSDAVDVDALETLLTPRESADGVTRVTFRYMGHEVTVTRERLRLEPLDR